MSALPDSLSPARRIATRIESDQQALDIARALAPTFAEGAAERDRERRLPFNEIDAYSASGLWGIAVPREFGGAQVSFATLAEVTAIISAADPALGQIPQNHFFMLDVLRVNGTRKQQAFYFERALAGDRFGNALSERGTKTVRDYRTSLTPDGAGFRLNGTKFYSTGALFAQWIPVVAKAADDTLYVAFTSADTPGLSVVDDWSGFGQRTTGSGTTVLDNVYVDATAVVPYSARSRVRGESLPRPRNTAQVSSVAQIAPDSTPSLASARSLPVNARLAMSSDTVNPIPATVPTPSTAPQPTGGASLPLVSLVTSHAVPAVPTGLPTM